MILADFLPPTRYRSWDFARQAGVTHAIARCHPRDTELNPPWDIAALRKVQRRFADAGITLIGLEGDEFDMRRIKLGLDGRDEDLALYQRMLANMGELGIPLLCYNFMATIGWCRTDTRVPARGGAITNRFQFSALDPAPVPPEDRVSEEKLWDNYTCFLRAVLPAAEKAGVKLGSTSRRPSPLAAAWRRPDFHHARGVCPRDGAERLAVASHHLCREFPADGSRSAGDGAPLRPPDRLRSLPRRRRHRGRFYGDLSRQRPTDMPALLRLYHEIGFRG